MTKLLSHCSIALCGAIILLLSIVGPIAAQQPESDASSVLSGDTALFNQPNPLWLPGADLRGKNLYGVALAGANLRAANLDNAHLAGAELAGALLVLATLRKADLTRANLEDAVMGLADLRAANLTAAILSRTQMQGVLLNGARLNGAHLTGTDLRQSDLRQASLRDARLQEARLAGSDLRGADLTGADLSGADLSGVNLANANLTGAKLGGVWVDALTIWPDNFESQMMAVTGSPAPDSPDRGQEKPDLAIMMTLTPDLVSWYNQWAEPYDTGLIDRPQAMGLLASITAGRRLVVFKSADLARQLVPYVADTFDVLGYNLEHGPLTPLHEQADPVGSVRQMRVLADEYGLQLALGPDHQYALSHGEAMAPFVDIYVMQVQRVQTRPDQVRDFVESMADVVRAANPEVETILQVRTDGDMSELATLIDSLRTSVDGIAILSSPETEEAGKMLVRLLRQTEERRASSPAASTDLPVDATHHEPSRTGLLLKGIGLQVMIVGVLALIFFIVNRVPVTRKEPL